MLLNPNTTPLYVAMQILSRLLTSIPLPLLLILALTLGLAPFTPEPHVWEKLKMLFGGTLTKSIDVLDLFMHGTPWILLLLRLLLAQSTSSDDSRDPD